MNIGAIKGPGAVLAKAHNIGAVHELPPTATVTGDYAEATASNPASALTNFVFLVDLSELPSGWWGDVDTTDPTKGRVTKEDGTELPSDWFNFDDVGETGFVRIKYTGTLAASGTQKVRIYPPLASRDSYEGSSQFGGHNAYLATEWAAYYPLQEDENDRTGSHDLTPSVAITPGDSTGKFGDATDFDGTDLLDHTRLTPITDEPMTFMAWYETDDAAGAHSLMGSTGALEYFHLAAGFSNVRMQAYDGSSVGTAFKSGVTNGVWQHAAGRNISGSSRYSYLDAVKGSQNTTSVGTVAADRLTVGGYGTASWLFDGRIQDAQFHKVDRGDDWIQHEFDQTDDNATFWGTWTWSGTGGPSSITGTANIVISEACTAQANGELAGAENIVLSHSASLAGKTSLTGTASITVGESATLGSRGVLTGTVALTISEAGTLEANAELTGTTPVTISATGSMAAPGAITGTASIAISESATIAGTGDLSAAPSITLSADGDLQSGANNPIDGTASVTITQAGSLNGTGTLVGSASITFTESGVVEGSGSLAGAPSVTLGENGTLTGQGDLTGAPAISITAVGALAGLGSNAMSGVANLTVTPNGSMQADAEISGSASTSIGGTANLRGRVGIDGTTSVAVSTTTSIGGRGSLSASPSVSVVTTGSFSGTGTLTGAPGFTIAASAIFTVEGTLRGAGNVTISASAMIRTGQRLIGSCKPEAVATGGGSYESVIVGGGRETVLLP